MPELVASGELLQATGHAGFETGLVHGSVAAEVAVGVTVDAELCHGLDIELGAKASAEAEALLAILLPAIRAEGQAFASAGVGLSVQLSPNLFDKIGFTAKAQAQAQASIAGRLAIGLDFHTVAELARQQLSGLAYDIFVAFLNELIVEGGVWGKASFAAMAKAHLQINGSLATDDDARFVITAGADAGWGGGTGWDFYGGIQFKDVKRFYHTTAHLITDEVVIQARERLPAPYRPAIALLDLLLPTVLVAAFELGQMSALELVRWAERADQNAAPFGRAFQRQLQRFMIDQCAELGGLMLDRYLDGLIARVSGDNLSATQRSELINRIETLIADLRSGPMTVARFPVLLSGIVDVAAIIAPQELRAWRRPLTMAWCALSLGESIRVAASKAGGGVSIGVVGVGDISATATIEDFAAPPQSVWDELEWFFETDLDAVTPADAVDYLVGIGLGPLLEELLPDLADMLQQLSQLLAVVDLTPGDVVEASLRGIAGGDLSDTDLYLNVRDWMRTSIEAEVIGDMLPALRVALGDSDDARLYLDEVVEPSLLMSTNFMFRSLDRVVQVATRPAPGSEFYDTFKTGLSSLVWRVASRNVVVIGDILTHHAVTRLHDSFEQLSDGIASDPNHPFVDGGTTLLTTLAPNLQGHPDDARVAVQDLFVDITHAGALAFGPQVWTSARRVQLRHLLVRLLDSIDTDLDRTDGDAIDKFFSQLAECWYKPDPDAQQELAELLAAAAPGFGVLTDAQKAAAVSTAQGVFLSAFLVIEPTIRLALPVRRPTVLRTRLMMQPACATRSWR